MTLSGAGTTRRARRGLALLYSIAVFAACSIPGDSLPMSILWSWDKVWHLLAFTVFAILWRRAGAGVLAAALGGFAFGAAIEVWQQFAPIGRFFDELDLAANAVGLLMGLTASLLWERLASGATTALPSATEPRPNPTGEATSQHP
jgi:VanZ family protein